MQDAARAAGMSKATATRRLADPAVRAQLDHLRTEVLERAADRLTGLALAAADTLAELMGDSDIPPSVRAKAADSILNRVTPVRDAAFVDRRIADLERARRPFMVVS